MIGNDIVDLSYARKTSNWQRPRWLNKLFTASERTLIAQSSNAEQMVWLLWSMKESAYKVFVQSGQTPCFAPKKLACRLQPKPSEKINGQVHYNNAVLSTQSILHKHYIHTLAFPTPKNTDYNLSIISLSDVASPRHHLYQHILQKYTRKSMVISASNADRDQHRDLRIKKNNQGVPFIFQGAVQQSTALSISHHGRYGAFVFTEC